MIWLYEKDDEALRIETRYDNRTLQYVLTVRRRDGTETERYEKLEDFRQRLLSLEKSLDESAWRRSGPPLLSTEGWADPRPT
jgi:hypothetical protein